MKQVLLVVDDDESMLDLITAICRQSLPEVRVVTAASGKQGLRLAREEQPGVVVLDVKLPDLHGFDVCQRIRNEPATANTHILMVSGVLMDAKDRIRGIENGADNYLFKPFEPAELVLQIRTLFRWWELEQAQLDKLEKLVAQRTQSLAEANVALQREVAERQRLAMVVEQAAETIVITDLQGTILYANPAFEQSSGYTCREALGQNPRFLKSGQQDAAFYQQLWATLVRGDIWRGHFANKHKDGTFYEEEATISPIRNAAGVVTNYVAFKLDITRERQLEEQIQQAQKMESVGRLAGGVAHDFNNSLQTILGYIEILLASMAREDERYADLLEIQKAANHSADLTRQLLAYSRKQMITLRPLDLNDVVGDAQKMLRSLLGADIQLVINLAAALPRVQADAGQLKQVLLNLAGNARAAMPRGGRLTISTHTTSFDEQDASVVADARPGRYVCLSVTDTGEGMSKAVMARIFEPFYSTKGLANAAGLGLSVIYGIIQQHQGWIHVYSEEGQGTTFNVYLPVFAVEADTTVACAAKPAPRPAGRGESILLIEDDPTVRNLAAHMLTVAGYKVQAAGTAAEACALFERARGQFDLLFSDIVLPDQSGVAVAQQLQKQKPGLPVLLCTGYTDERTRWTALAQQPYPVLHKPYPAAELQRQVRHILAAAAAAKPPG